MIWYSIDIMMTDYNNIKEFVKKIETIYTNELIYRALIITNDINDRNNIEDILTMNDHSVKVFTEINPEINYDKLDNRIFIIEYTIFKEFVNHMINRYGIENLPYNLIIFSYDLDNVNIDKLKKEYNGLTNSNMSNTIII